MPARVGTRFALCPSYKIAPHFTRKNELIFAGAKVVFEKDKIGAGCLQGHIGILRQPGTLVLISCVKTVHEKNKSMKFQGYRPFFSLRADTSHGIHQPSAIALRCPILGTQTSASNLRKNRS